jgi:hypothetical protein
LPRVRVLLVSGSLDPQEGLRMRSAAFGALFLLLCVLGVVAASDDPAGVDTAVGVDPRQLFEHLLVADLPLEARKRALKPYVGVGRARSEIEKLLPRPSSIGGGGLGIIVVNYGGKKEPDLTVEYYLGGGCYKVSYRGKDGKTATLWTDGLESPLLRTRKRTAERR